MTAGSRNSPDRTAMKRPSDCDRWSDGILATIGSCKISISVRSFTRCDFRDIPPNSTVRPMYVFGEDRRSAKDIDGSTCASNSAGMS